MKSRKKTIDCKIGISAGREKDGTQRVSLNSLPADCYFTDLTKDVPKITWGHENQALTQM